MPFDNVALASFFAGAAKGVGETCIGANGGIVGTGSFGFTATSFRPTEPSDTTGIGFPFGLEFSTEFVAAIWTSA